MSEKLGTTSGNFTFTSIDELLSEIKRLRAVVDAAKAMRGSGDLLLIGDVTNAADAFDAALAKLEKQ